MTDDSNHNFTEIASQQEIPTSPRRSLSTGKWVLPFAFLLSILVHVVIVVGASHLFNLPGDSQNGPNAPATVRLVQGIPQSIVTGSKASTVKKKTPSPRTKSVPAHPQRIASLPPRPIPAQIQKAPTVHIAAPAVKHTIKSPEKEKQQETTTIVANPSVPNSKPDAEPVTSGNETDSETEPDTQIMARPDVLPSPRPITIAKDEARKPVTVEEENSDEPAMATPVEVAEANRPGSTGDTPTVAEISKEKTDSTTYSLGINRGVPFGDIFGVSDTTSHNLSKQFALARTQNNEGNPSVHIVYVLDVSGSMEEGDKIGRVRIAMEKALSELRAEDYFNIVLFSDSAKLFSKKMLPATPANISAGISTIDKANPNGSTNLSSALERAFGQADVTHIFILSDGDPTEGITDFDKIIELSRQENNSNARVITLALGRGEKFKGMELLRQLAEAGKGKFSYINLSNQK